LYNFIFIFGFLILSYILAASISIANNSFTSIISLSTLDISVGGCIPESLTAPSSSLLTSSSTINWLSALEPVLNTSLF